MSPIDVEEASSSRTPAVSLAAAAALAAGGVMVLFVAGHLLAGSHLGALTAVDSNHGQRFGAVVLVVVAGGLFGVARALAEARDGLEWFFDPLRVVVLGVPALVVALLAVPPMVGVRWASAIVELPLIGDAVRGAPGQVLAGAAALMLGYAIAAGVRSRIPVAAIVEAYEEARAAASRTHLMEFGDDG